MGKKEKIFPKNTIGGRIYELRNRLGFNTPSGRVDFYNFLYDNVKIDDSSKMKNVYNWECSEDSIPIPVLKKICEKCNCSSDYLIGIEKEINHDLHFICNYTGLSENAVDTIANNNASYSPLIVSTINFLLEPDNTINDKKELFSKIINYILLSDNIASYMENNVPKMENEKILLYDKYGKAVGQVETKDMKEAMALSIITTLNTIKDNTHVADVPHPTIYDCLEQILDDILEINALRAEENAICYADRLSICERRIAENTKRLQYIYECECIDNIDFEEFKKRFHYKYNDEECALLKEHISI